jgi:hypothetical protein
MNNKLEESCVESECWAHGSFGALSIVDSKLAPLHQGDVGTYALHQLLPTKTFLLENGCHVKLDRDD